MSIFGSIMSKIFHHADAAPASGPADTGSTPPAATTPSAPADPFGSSSAQPAAQPDAPTQQSAGQPVDVDAVLTGMASQKGGGGNYRTSIVDLLKLLDLDSSLDARKQLGTELGVHAGADGSAEQNIALQKAVMAKLAENGGIVPASLRG